MRLESLKLLYDVQQAAELIRQFASGRTLDDFESDAMLRSAVERQFEIVGEAVGRLAKSDPPTAARITDHRKMISFCNVLIHGYDVVTNEITWEIIKNKLPILISETQVLLAEPETP